MASFQSQYGIRLVRELRNMSWREFSAYLSGLDNRSPLGRIIAIRAEDDAERLRNFTPEMQQIRLRWRTRRAKAMPQQDVNEFLEAMKNAFINMAGGLTNGQDEEADVSEVQQDTDAD